LENNNENKALRASGMSFETIIAKAMELPFVKIDRTEFLTKQFGNIVRPKTMERILAEGTVKAHVKISALNRTAKEAINFETAKATAISTVAGLPGGLAMIGTIPADFTQFYAHVFRIAQKLAYIYGWQELGNDEGTQNRLILFLGVMSGVQAAGKAVMQFAVEVGPKIGARVTAKPLTKMAWYPIVKSVLRMVGVKITKDTVGKTISKAIPIVGGVLSGGLTFATYRQMSTKLANFLSRLAQMTPEEFDEYFNKEDSMIEAELVDVDEEVAAEDADKTSV
jgi:hypothetical protein